MAAFWLLVLAMLAPLAGVVSALILIAGQPPRAAAATACVRLGMAGSCLASAALMCVLVGEFGTSSMTVSVPLWTWLELSGPRPLHIGWVLQADPLAAGWVTVLSGLARDTLSSTRRSESESRDGAFAVTAGMLHLAAVAFVFAGNLAQMLLCWEAVLLTTGLMVGWSATNPETGSTIRKLLRTGLTTDGFVVVAVILMGLACGTFSIDGVFSTGGLSRLGERIPALPGFVGCLLVLGVLGRSGLFPCFGWHQGASAWEGRVWTMVYLVGYVPSAIWLLLRCQPVLETSERTLELLGGLGTLGAVLGAFVACGQDEPRRAWAFLVTAQVGVVFALLASGLMDAALLRAWWLGQADAMPRPADVTRLLIGQLAVIVGGLVLWRATGASRAVVTGAGATGGSFGPPVSSTSTGERSPSPVAPDASRRPSTRPAAWESLARLSRERLYVDEVTGFVFSTLGHAAIQLARFVDRLLTEAIWPAFGVRYPGWLGQQAEALEVRRVEFTIATLLLGAATLLLTLVMVT